MNGLYLEFSGNLDLAQRQSSIFDVSDERDPISGRPDMRNSLGWSILIRGDRTECAFQVWRVFGRLTLPSGTVTEPKKVFRLKECALQLQ